MKAFTYRDFRTLWMGAFTSTVGTWMQKVAQSWLALSLTVSAFHLGLDDFLAQLPILLFTMIGGVIADRHDRRRLLIASQYVLMASAFTLAALVLFGRADAVCRQHRQRGTTLALGPVGLPAREPDAHPVASPRRL